MIYDFDVYNIKGMCLYEYICILYFYYIFSSDKFV